MKEVLDPSSAAAAAAAAAAVMVEEESSDASVANANNKAEAWTCSCGKRWPAVQKRCGNTKCNKVSAYVRWSLMIIHSIAISCAQCHSLSLSCHQLFCIAVERRQARCLHCPPSQCTISTEETTTTTTRCHYQVDMPPLPTCHARQQSSMWKMSSLEGWQAHFV